MGGAMHIYVFSSKNLTNIWAGIGAHKWAVSKVQGDNQSIRTKAKNLPIGSLGLLYCVDSQSFTTPFLITSKPGAAQKVENIWPEMWVLPFSISPLGTPKHQLHKDKLATLLPSLNSGKQWSHVLHVQPLTVFAPSEISDDDWAALVSVLIPQGTRHG